MNTVATNAEPVKPCIGEHRLPCGVIAWVTPAKIGMIDSRLPAPMRRRLRGALTRHFEQRRGMAPGLLTVDLVGAVLDLSGRQVRRLAAAGKIPGARVDRYFTPAGMRTGWVFDSRVTGPWTVDRLVAGGYIPQEVACS